MSRQESPGRTAGAISTPGNPQHNGHGRLFATLRAEGGSPKALTRRWLRLRWWWRRDRGRESVSIDFIDPPLGVLHHDGEYTSLLYEDTNGERSQFRIACLDRLCVYCTCGLSSAGARGQT